MRARVAAGVVALVAVGGAVWLLAPSGRSATPAANDHVPLGVATAGPHELVDRTDVDGTLGFADGRTLGAPAAGTLTRLRAEGTVVGRGLSLLSVDARATAWVLYGSLPMYRDLGPGVSDGGDVRQLERNLAALGYDPGTIDATWTSATTAAVKAFQADRDLTETGTLTPAEVVVSDGPVRVGAHKAQVGDQVHPGAPVTTISSTRPVVTAKVDAGQVESLHRGDPVPVTLPSGRTVHGTISTIGTTATAGQDGSGATVDLEVVLHGRRRSGLEGALVTLSLATDRIRAALAVPVTALVTTGAGAYAVELAGSHRLVPVSIGASAGGWVEITGGGLTRGARVVVPR